MWSVATPVSQISNQAYHLDLHGLRPYQVECLHSVYEHAVTGCRRMLVALPTGCHQANQGILMHDGAVKPVQDIVVGDMLMGLDSMPRLVLDTFRGMGPMVRVKPVKGDPWIVNDQHILTLVQTKIRNGDRGRFPSTVGGQIRDVSIPDWQRWSKTKRHIHKLFRVGVEFPGVEEALEAAAIDPYCLGVFLGDGTLATEGVAHVTTPDPEILGALTQLATRHGLHVRQDGIHKRLAGTPGRRNPITTYLRQLGLSGIKGEHRFVPDAYRRASRAIRLEILAGLLDTDGFLTGGGYEFLSKSPRLANDVVFLGRSLGLAAFVKERYMETNFGEGTFYRVSISGNCSILPLRVRRKQAPVRRQIKDVLRTSFQIEPTGTWERYFGFSLAGDGRYLLDDFTVTHNTGKTEIFARLPYMMGGRRMLVIAHREELLDQAQVRIAKANPNLQVGIEQAERHASVDDDVVVASIQTFAVSPHRLDDLDPDSFAVVVIDECHHMLANTYLELLYRLDLAPDPLGCPKDKQKKYDYYRAFKPDGRRYLIGFTATPHRTDGVGLESILDEMAYSRTIEEMMREGWLCPIRGERIHTGINLRDVKSRGGDFIESQLSAAVNTADRNELVVGAYKALAAPEHRRALVFCVDVAHTEAVCELFQESGVIADYIIGTTLPDRRHNAIEAFRAGHLEVLVNCMVLTEGFDAPETDCILLARPTKSSLLYTQMLGRGTRIAPGKQDLLVIDVADASAVGVNNLNTLFGLPPALETKEGVLSAKDAVDEVLDEAPVDADRLTMARTIEEIEEIARRFNPLEVKRADDMGQTMAWVKTSYGFALGLGVGEQVGIVIDLLGHADVRVKQGPDFLSLGEFGEIDTALQAAEVWVRNARPAMAKIMNKNAYWRIRGQSLPPTDRQQVQLRRFLAMGKINVIPEGLTKTQASDMLGKLFAERNR